MFRKEKESGYIEVVFGNAFEFRGLSVDLIPTIKALEEKLMPVMLRGHEQQKELHILTLQANGAVIAKQADETMEGY
jgi:predicted ABC-type transport system involved in lysophospholipase L1 biosynthesis ATPase subunit